MTTGKTIALTMQTFVGKVISLLLDMLPRFVIAFHPRRKCLLISWLQSLSAGPSSLFLSAPGCKTLEKERTWKMTDYISDGCFILFSEM